MDAGLDAIEAAGRADVVAVLAFPLPFTLISEMLGVPLAEQGRIRALTGSLVRALEPLTGPDLQVEIRDASTELTGMLRELAGWKRAHPADDLFSACSSATTVMPSSGSTPVTARPRPGAPARRRR